MSVRLMHGDTVEQMRSLPSESFDAVVTDPPYGLGFMGVGWDTFRNEKRKTRRQTTAEAFDNVGGNHNPSNAQDQARTRGVEARRFQAWANTWTPEVYRVLKPGAHLLAFGGTRTHHRLMCAIEDAGFEIRDTLMWLHGQGFPKGKSQLKPAWEPIILARKPGKGAGLNIDAARIGTTKDIPASASKPRVDQTQWRISGDLEARSGMDPNTGRWPPNVALSHNGPDENGEGGCQEVGTRAIRSTNAHGDQARSVERTVPFDLSAPGTIRTYGNGDGTETVPAFECVESCAVRLLDEQAGERPSSFRQARTTDPVGSTWALNRDDQQPFGYTDQGSVSRFFYTSKASAADRRPYNDHPTVKSTDLMRWLITLVTPPGGHLLDPFCGSGSTLVAADRLGFSATGIDSDAHALDIARRRLAEDGGMFSEVVG